VLVGVAIAAALIVILLVVSSSKPDPLPDPPVLRPPTSALKKPDPPPSPPPPQPPAIPKEKIAQELKELEAKIQPSIKGEQFAAVVDLLEEARRRYDVPDWTQPMAKRIQEVREMPSALFSPLKEQACSAQARGAGDEARQVRTRVASWGRKDLVDELDQALAAIVPHEALPAGAKVLVSFPKNDSSRYRYAGTQKDGALLAIPGFGGAVVGFESGSEICKVPTEGELRVVYTTNSDKMLTVTLRCSGPDGKNYPYNYWVKHPAVGGAQLLKVRVAELKNWANQLISPGAIVDNIYVRQDDPAAVLRIHEFVLYRTKE
jgi:hypothetical protein